MNDLVGEKVPDRKLSDAEGNLISPAQFKGKYAVLYFYPKDMTPGCTTEACDFRDQFESFKDADAVIIGVSPDPAAKHKKFAAKYELPFYLLSDEKLELSKAMNVWQLKKNFGKEYMGIVRSTYVIDPEGTIIKEWKNVRVKGHVQQALEFIQSQKKE
ncbi:peroxiredoxin [Alkalicoccus halolimnae]|uniref:thioredoxin-dependent peroxiredoxin n=1 Tax=Alkalicoccus halolimnae TaxID=1667239 RepID=A0A5C7F3F7_9BACI|nr:peroxiredoxin [Alkalicoccus halolimnae]TXF85191.1 peroxiredoxin [Alkalicoccus halolimnae]